MDMSEISKALEASKTELKQLFEAQRGDIAKNNELGTNLQKQASDLQADIAKLGTRLFDMEQAQKQAPKSGDTTKSWQDVAAESLQEGWKKSGGISGRAEVGTFQKTITSVGGSGGALIEPMRIPGILRPGDRRMTIRDLMSQGRTTSNSFEYVRENVFTNNAAIVAENTLKPESNITFTKETATIKTMAHWIQASRQVMDDAPALSSYIDNRLLFGLMLKEEAQLLNGDGLGDNLIGLNHATASTAYDITLNLAGENASDKLAHAVYQVSLSEFEATGYILNPLDWHRIALLKDSTGQYILGGPQAFASKVLWGLPVVTTLSQTAGTFTVGAFSLANQVWDRMDAAVETSREDRDNFVKNMLTILAEQRLGVAHYRPAAIVKGTF
jgi:HK97 family phage major capsid protein